MRTLKELLTERINNLKEERELLKIEERFFHRKVLADKAFERTLSQVQQNLRDYDEKLAFLDEVLAEIV